MTITFIEKVLKFKKNKFINSLNKVRETAGTRGGVLHGTPTPR